MERGYQNRNGKSQPASKQSNSSGLRPSEESYREQMRSVSKDSVNLRRSELNRYRENDLYERQSI